MQNEGKRKMRKAITTAMLTLALTSSVYTGEMQTGLTGTTSTTQGIIQNGVAQDGDIPNGAPGEIPNGGAGTSSQVNILDGAEVTFTLMQSLLGLL
jgi:hypothetical protein